MATDLYLRALAPTLWTGGTWFSLKDAARGVTPGADLFEGANTTKCFALSTTIGTGAGTATTEASITGTTAGILIGRAANPFAYISPPLSASATIAGTVGFDMCGLESSMNANATFIMALYRVGPDGTLTLIISSRLVTELGTALARMSWTGAPTSTVCAIGDRLLLLPMFDDAAALTMGSGFTLTLQIDGANANTADSRVVLTETLSFLTSDPTGTAYFLRDTASDVSGAKALSTTQGAGTVEATHTTVVGPLAFPGDQWTATAGGADIEWFTPALDAFTLSEAVKATLTNSAAVLESQVTTPFDSITCELAICDADGTNPAVWARSYTSTTSGADAKPHYLTGPPTSVPQGKRLRFRVYQDDARPAGNAVAGTSRVIRYDGVSTYASALTFTQTITEETAGNAPQLTGKIRL